MTPANITQTSAADWKYVSEGGATIVFSYIGPPNTSFDGTVLRLRKKMFPDGIHVRALELAELPDSFWSRERRSGRAEEIAPDVDEPDDPMIAYQHRCMERLLPKENLPRLDSVLVEADWLEALAALHYGDRPEERRMKDGIDFGRRKGVLATDLVGGQGLAVEIKPKWAFLPNSTHLSEATRSVKTQTCRFCMHSNLKASEGDVVALGYCPLDLFSGDPARIGSAIGSLWDAWHSSAAAVNNLKIFIQGKSVNPADNPSALAAQLSLSDAASLLPMTSLRDAFTKKVVALLTETRVLRVLSDLQRSLDVLDIEGLSKLWKLAEEQTESDDPASHATVSTTPIGVSSTLIPSPEPTIADWDGFLDTYLDAGSHFDSAAPDIQNLRYYLLAYLLAATFKDCSIILRFGPQFSTSGENVNGTGAVTVIDLDPKSMDRLRKWEKMDAEIATRYSSLADPKTCVDARYK